jgi:transposase-like protein
MENKNLTSLEYEVMKQKFKEQFRTGKSLFSKGGAFAPLLEHLINSMLEEELDAYLDDERRIGNRKNGKGRKVLKTSAGSIDINTPRDRLGSFEPELVKKGETIMAASLEDNIIGLYGLGISLRDISTHIK